ncbi:MAG TPA: Re/Si-specific NAD(P)(+) transhydrogenase subunit alpha [Spirochaetia bacterium]|nr:Re/Si-specific NAD(P)(+) transhydrogenase subunit alpha [Spirochaetia bacterium]
MIIGIPKETDPKERRVPLVPQTAKRLAALGAGLVIEQGAGLPSGFDDREYRDAGAKVLKTREEVLSGANIVLRLNVPPKQDVALLKPETIHISYLDPFNQRKLVETMAAARIAALSMEMIPRSTRAQKMDALSSQASLAGYVAVILAAERLAQVFPMMMTPAGTLSPARVFVIGAGVAGLQAIATAKRLGARVEAFDTRPVVAEQVQSLGARFVQVDLGETGETKDGYAKTLAPEQLARQQEAMAKHCALADVVITTAQVFGRKAPLIVTEEIIKSMKPGSIIVDMAVESGGNVAGSEADLEVVKGPARILGYTNLAGRVPAHASQMYSSNAGSLIEEFWDKEKKEMVLDPDDEIIQGCLITRGGEICNGKLKEIYQS